MPGKAVDDSPFSVSLEDGWFAYLLIRKLSTSLSSCYCYTLWLFLSSVGCFSHISQNKRSLLVLVTACLSPKDSLKVLLLLHYKRLDLEEVGFFFSFSAKLRLKQAAEVKQTLQQWNWIAVLLENLRVRQRAKTSHKLNDCVELCKIR